MAKKTQPVLTVTDPIAPTWQPEPETERVMDEADERIDEIFSEAPQNEPCIELFRVNPQGGRPLYLEAMTPLQYSLDYVCQKYGGGRYFARAKYKDGRRVRMPIEIEGEPFPVKRIRKEDLMERPVNGGAVAIVPGTDLIRTEGGGGGDLGAVVQMLVREMKNSEVQMLEKMRLYKELFGSSALSQPQAPLDQLLNMFQKGIEMAGGQGDGGNPWLSLAREFKEPLTKIVETVQLALKRPAPVNAQTVSLKVKPAPLTNLAGSDVITEPPTPVEFSTKETPDMKAHLLQMLPLLINGASKNTDPGLYVDFILDQLPRSAYTELRDWLATEGCLDQLALLEPGIRFQQEWWNGLRGGLLDAVNEELNHAIRPIQSEQNSNPATSASPAGGATDRSSESAGN